MVFPRYRHLVTLLHYPENMKIFKRYCLDDSHLAGLRYLVKPVPKLIEWRWGEIVTICEILIPQRTVLGIFDAKKFEAGAKQDDARGGADADADVNPEPEVDGVADAAANDDGRPAREGKWMRMQLKLIFVQSIGGILSI